MSSRTRKVGIVAAMWLLGAAAMAAFAWLVQWLDGAPVRVPAAADPPALAPVDEPMAALTSGVARSLAASREHLANEERGEAMHALDSALRGAEVGHEVSHGEVKSAFAVALREIHFARQAMHLGDAGEARDDMEDAQARLTAAIEAARELAVGVPPPEVWDAYRGAVLVNANGAMIGQVQRIEARDGSPTAVLHLGGANDVLGLLEFGGRTAGVAADRLLWGPRRSIGSIFVALPAEASEPDTILSALTG